MSTKTAPATAKKDDNSPAPAAKSTADTFFRFSRVESDSADEANRTVQVAFSSEALVLRKAGASEEALGIAKKGTRYLELLSHKRGDADFSELNTGEAAVLDEHNDSLQIGNVKRAKVSKDGIGRAVLQFDGASELSKTRFQQMCAGTRKGISCGYVHTRFIADEGEKDGIPIKRIAWAADEISSVRNAADKAKAGVRRSADGQWSCIGCGEMFGAEALDENYECEACKAEGEKRKAESGKRKAENQSEHEKQPDTMNRATIRDLTNLFYRAEGEKISLNNISSAVNSAIKTDERFCKNEKGEVCSYCYVQDVVVIEKGVVDGKDVDELKAIICAADGKYYQVDVTYANNTATLGEAVEVRYAVEYTPVRSAGTEGNQTRSEPVPQNATGGTPVDLAASANADTGAQNLTQTRTTPMPEPTTPIVVDEAKVRSEAETAFKARAKEIGDVTDQFIKDHGRKNGGKLGEKLRALAVLCIGEGISLEAFKTRALTEVVAAKPATQVRMADLTNGEDASSYSILRGIQACVRNKSNVPDGLEGEIHQEILARAKADGGLGYEAEGFQVPADANIRAGIGGNRMTRDMTAGVFNAGGAFVPTQLVTPVIELLRNMMILDRVGVRKMAGLQGNIVIPRQEAAATAYSVAETALLTASQQVLGQIALTPKRVGATQTYSKQFVIQSSPDAEAFMRDDLFKVIALAWDRLGLNGQGAGSEPMGIINTPGVGSIVFGTTPTYAKIVDFATRIEAANVTDPISYVTTPTAKGVLKITPATLTGSTVVSGATNALWTGKGMEGELNGWPAYATNQVPNNLMIAGAFNQLIQALWGGLDVVVDQYTKAANAEIVLTINTWGDYAIRHPQAFVVSADAANL